MVTLQHWSLLKTPEKGRRTLTVPPWSRAVLHLAETELPGFSAPNKNILEMLHIICHSQLWYIRRNTRQDIPWPGMNPVAGEKAERKLPWSKKDRYKKAAPNPTEEQRRRS